ENHYDKQNAMPFKFSNIAFCFFVGNGTFRIKQALKRRTVRAPLPRDSIVSMRIGKTIDASRTNDEEFL
ncbi:hypothetical protein QTO03_21455, partial [Vibrio campbellii]|uniref:hypothetical protein n=1 Tax=Vibrio campbellii TaxID=680 RepID=UPI002F420F57